MNPNDLRWKSKTAALNRWQTLVDDAAHKFDRAKELAEDAAQNIDFALGDIDKEMADLKKAGQEDTRKYAMLAAMKKLCVEKLRTHYDKAQLTKNLSDLWYAFGSHAWDKWQ